MNDHEVSSDYLFGADGSNSKVRRLLQEKPRVGHSLEYMPAGYMELSISPDEQGQHKLEPLEALHIWPRGDFMLIALPNTDGSFTCTLFLNHEGEISFQALQTEETVYAFFEQYFVDALPQTALGKTDKKALRQRYWGDQSRMVN